jgi:uncharacterized membrane protein YraQ (UPF0718 family)
MQTSALYVAAFLIVLISWFNDRQKTKMAIKKSWKALENILPQILGVITLVGIVLAILNPSVIGSYIGSDSGWKGVAAASMIGAITLIPGFIAFPTAAMLLNRGAGFMQIGAFISSLMMVGIMTLPIEIKYFGRKSALIRNSTAFVFSFFVAWVIGKVMGEL